MVWSVERKVNLGVVVGLTLLLVADGLSLKNLSGLRRSAENVVQSHEIISELDGLLLQIQSAETGQRGFIITGNESFLGPYHEGVTSTSSHAAILLENFRRRPDHKQFQRLQALQALIADKCADMDKTIREVREGQQEEARRHVSTGRGKRTMDLIRSLVADIKANEFSIMVQRNREVEEAAKDTAAVIITESLLGMTLLTISVVIVRSHLAARKVAEERREHLEVSLRRSEKLSAMGALVAGVAHAVRNPLFGISATLDAMEARFKDGHEYSKYFLTLHRECDRLTKLMKQLLLYGKPAETGPLAAILSEVVAEAVEAASPMAEHSGVSIAIFMPDTLSPGAIERNHLLMILQNLLENSIQHSATGDEVRLAVSQVEEGQTWIECTVQDNGPGFDSEDLQHVFEPFYSRRSGGTGLGLAIVYRIVDQLGGRIWAANRTEGGGTVTFRLPATEVGAVAEET